jgi:hypothetical protein
LLCCGFLLGHSRYLFSEGAYLYQKGVSETTN